MHDFSVIKVRDKHFIGSRYAKLYPTECSHSRTASPVYHSNIDTPFWRESETFFYAGLPGIVFTQTAHGPRPNIVSLLWLYHEFLYNSSGRITSISIPYTTFSAKCILTGQQKISCPPWASLFRVLDESAFKTLSQKCRIQENFTKIISHNVVSTSSLYCHCKFHSLLSTTTTPIHPASSDVCGSPLCVTCYKSLFRTKLSSFLSLHRLNQLLPRSLLCTLLPSEELNYQRVFRGMVYYLLLHTNTREWPPLKEFEKIGFILTKNPIVRLFATRSPQLNNKVVSILGIERWAAFKRVERRFGKPFLEQHGNFLLTQGRCIVSEKVPKSLLYTYPGTSFGDILIDGFGSGRNRNNKLVHLFEFKRCFELLKKGATQITIRPCYDGYRPSTGVYKTPDENSASTTIVDAHFLTWAVLYSYLKTEPTELTLYGKLYINGKYSVINELTALAAANTVYHSTDSYTVSVRCIRVILESSVHTRSGALGVEGAAEAKAVRLVNDTSGPVDANRVVSLLSGTTILLVPPCLSKNEDGKGPSRTSTKGKKRKRMKASESCTV